MDPIKHQHLQLTMRSQMFPRSIVLASFVALSGCVAQVLPITIPDIERSNQTSVSDLRPALETKEEEFSILLTSEKYGISRVGEGRTNPSALRAFQHRIYEKFGAAKPRIKIHHLVVYRNGQAEFRSGAVTVGLLSQGFIFVPGRSSTSDAKGNFHVLVNSSSFEAMKGDEEYKRAALTQTESPSGGSAYIVFIESEVDDKRVFSRTVAPFRIFGSGNQNLLHTLPAAIEAAVQYHLDQL